MSGLPGAGKTTASEFFIAGAKPVIRMGEVTELQLIKKNLETGEANESSIRQGLREKYGDDIYAKKTFSKILKIKDTNALIIIEGIRSMAELRYFFTRLKKHILLYIDTDRELRHNRLKKRKKRPLKILEIALREKYEIDVLGVTKLKEHADYIVKNNSSKSNFFSRLENVLIDIN